MLSGEGPARSSQLAVPVRATEVVLNDDANHPFALILPPIEELAEIDSTRARVASHEVMRNERMNLLTEHFELQYQRELDKQETLGGFSTFHSRLAELAQAAGKLDEQAAHLARARSKSADPFFAHKQIDLFVSQQNFDLAESESRGLDLAKDIYANLRMAMFRLYQNRQEEAFEFVEKACSIDGLDYRARMFEGGLSLLRRDFRRAIRAFRIDPARFRVLCCVYPKPFH